MTTLQTLYETLAQYFFPYRNEDELQRGIEAALTHHSIPFVREYQLTKSDRLDFFCDGIAIEIKIGGSNSEVIRQLHRYLKDDRVEKVLLVTSRAKHLNIPHTLNDKSIMILWVGGNSL